MRADGSLVAREPGSREGLMEGRVGRTALGGAVMVSRRRGCPSQSCQGMQLGERLRSCRRRVWGPAVGVGLEGGDGGWASVIRAPPKRHLCAFTFALMPVSLLQN